MSRRSTRGERHKNTTVKGLRVSAVDHMCCLIRLRADANREHTSWHYTRYSYMVHRKEVGVKFHSANELPEHALTVCTTKYLCSSDHDLHRTSLCTSHRIIVLVPPNSARKHACNDSRKCNRGPWECVALHSCACNSSNNVGVVIACDRRDCCCLHPPRRFQSQRRSDIAPPPQIASCLRSRDGSHGHTR